jgi:hypothetical protein
MTEGSVTGLKILIDAISLLILLSKTYVTRRCHFSYSQGYIFGRSIGKAYVKLHLIDFQ